MRKYLLLSCALVLASATTFAYDIPTNDYGNGATVSGYTDHYQYGGCQVLNVTPGGLAGLVNEGFTNDAGQAQTVDVLDRTTIVIKGEMNSSDLAAIQGLSSAKNVIMKEVTFSEGTDLSQFATSNTLEYAVFPPSVTDLSDLRNASLGSKFKVAVAVDAQTPALTAYSNQEGYLAAAVCVEDGQPNPQELWGGYWCKYTGSNASVHFSKFTLAGNLSAIDLIGNWPNNNDGYILADNGHLYNPSLPDDVGRSDYATGSWGNGPSYVTDLDLTYANFVHITDMSLSDLGYTHLTNLSLPISEDTIPSRCLLGTSSLTSLCVPSNYKVIQANAFPSSLTHITTTAVDDEGNTVVIDNGPLSITLSAGLEMIESFAFTSITGVKDVYCLGTTAPKCQINAFSSITYCANNTIISTGAVTRDSYKCGDGWMAVLHYPNTCDGTNIRRYTDVTRDFSVATGEKDGNGNLIMFPNQSELNRAESQSMAGYIWNDCDKNRGLYTNAQSTYPLQIGNFTYKSAEEAGVTDIAQIQSKMKELYDNCTGTVETLAEDGSIVSTPNCPLVTKADKTQTVESDYIGWHQFLLGSYTLPEDPEFIYNLGGVYDNEWWTICLPFEMTKAQVNQYFGGNENNEVVRVCEFVAVNRIQDTKIVLCFGPNLMTDQNKGDDDIIIEAGHPYMIKPNLNIAQANADPQSRVIRIPIDQLSDKMKEYNSMDQAAMMKLVKDNVVVVGPDNIRLWDTMDAYESGDDPVATAATDQAKAHDNGVNAPYFNYAFVGSFWKYCLPQYCYFLGFANNKVQYFWRYKAIDQANRSWNTCTAIICPNWDTNAKLVAPASGLETIHWDFIPATGAEYTFSQSDAYKGWEETKSANVELLFEGETDGIQQIHTENGVMTNISGTIYNLNGQVVGRKGNTNNLGKGIYVVGGKKFVVK